MSMSPNNKDITPHTAGIDKTSNLEKLEHLVGVAEKNLDAVARAIAKVG